ncbi:MAG TPA: N-acyl homoserine lactonase family protein [Micropepsaceae bacterium]|nr:N-acyl homoserine lactonase family protein [Micropepsaceae bacterium]
MSNRIVAAILATAMSVAAAFLPASAQQTQAPQSLRLYVLDCGIITPPNVDNYGFKSNEVADTRMITPCFLIVHPRGTLMWDTGEISDSAFKTGVSPQKLNNFTVTRPLLPQLAAIGYTPANITYLALSHYHADHVANASLFAGSTWIVQKGDRDPILAPRPADPSAAGRVPDPKFFAGLANSKTILLNGEDHDVFGDGTVVIKFTPGHTPGHQSLFLKLAHTGNVLLTGDLYHYPEELTAKKVPLFDANRDQTAKSRATIETFVKQNHAQLWIQHDYAAGMKRKLAPQFYD